MQQDNAVGACAQAAIWMALRTLRRKEGRSAFNPSQITSAATRFLVPGRILPNRSGLSIEQISEAIRSAGYAIHNIPLRNTSLMFDPVTAGELDHAKQVLYPYIESGIPVLLAVIPPGGEGHAILLIGHGWSDTPSRMIQSAEIAAQSFNAPVKVYDAASWVEPFYVHNDNTGPYLPLTEASPNIDHGYCLAHAITAIPFLPSDVFMDASEARLECHKLLKKTLEDYGDEVEDKYQIPDIVTRLYLIDRSEYRYEALRSGMPDDLKTYYRKKWLPRRIWVMELNASDGYHQSPHGSGRRLGEILLDPASEPKDAAFLSIHLSTDLLAPHAATGVMIDRDGLTGKISAFPMGGASYSPRVR